MPISNDRPPPQLRTFVPIIIVEIYLLNPIDCNASKYCKHFTKDNKSSNKLVIKSLVRH